MTKELMQFNAEIDYVRYLYVNVYVALVRWVEANRANPDMITTFGDDDDDDGPSIKAAEVLAIDLNLYRYAMLHLISQMGRILDHYLRVKVQPLMTIQPVDDSWYSLDAVEALSGVTLREVFGYDAVLALAIHRATIEALGSLPITQVEVLQLAKRVAGFAEDFEARFDLAAEARRTYPRRQKAQKEAQRDQQTKPHGADLPGADGGNNRPAGRDAGSLSERPNKPRTSLGPSDGHPDSDTPGHWNDGGPDPVDADHTDDGDRFDGNDWPDAA